MTKKRQAAELEAVQVIHSGTEEFDTKSGDTPKPLMGISGFDSEDQNIAPISMESYVSDAVINANQMTRLSKQEAEDYKLQLSEWQKLQRVDTLMSEVADKAQFYAVSQGGLKFWREAFVGMSCAQLTHALRFRLGDDPPDFELDYGNFTLKFELVTALPSGVKLGAIYNKYADDLNKNGSTKLHTPSYDQEKFEYDSVISDVKALIEAKCAKLYPEKYILVVDIHHAVYFESDFGVIQGLERIARKGLRNFQEVWLRQSSRILRVSPVSSSMISLPWSSDE